jgi:hypothetical protein
MVELACRYRISKEITAVLFAGTTTVVLFTETERSMGGGAKLVPHPQAVKAIKYATEVRRMRVP